MRKLIGLSFLLFIFLIQCKESGNNKIEILDKNIIFCGAENVASDKNFFEEGGVYFSGAKNVSYDSSYEGDASIKLTKEAPTGMRVSIENVLPGSVFEVQVYRKSSDGKGSILASSDNENLWWEESTCLAEKDEEGWEFILMRFKTPMNMDSLRKVDIFLGHQNSEGAVYFDNLQIMKLEDKEDSLILKKDIARIQLSDIDFKAIGEARDEAIKNGQITSDLKKTYPGFLTYQNKTYNVEVRLKGDWADHLSGNKWSFRVKVKNGETILGMKSFSIQDPKTRGYLHEWVLHELLKEEDVLTTKFNFLPFSINGSNYGIYAVEEHFEKQLIESNNRREGVIVKFNEEGLWEQRAQKGYWDNHENNPDLAYESSTIEPFKRKKTKKDTVLFNQFLRAQNLMTRYKNGDSSLHEYMDIDKLAKAYALLSIANVDHSMIWHNQRFYYNPVISKLELIVFDCYPSLSSAQNRYPLIFGGSGKTNDIINTSLYCSLAPINSLEFQKAYLKYLQRYTKESFIKNFITSKTIEIDSIVDLFVSDYLAFDYDKNYLSENSHKVQMQIANYKSRVEKQDLKYKREEPLFSVKCKSHAPLNNISLRAHIEQKDKKAMGLSIGNYHCHPLSLIGYSIATNKDSIIMFPSQLIVNRFNDESETKRVKVPFNTKRLFYKTNEENNDSIYKSKIFSWPQPVSTGINDKGKKHIQLNESSPYISVNENTITFKKGRHTIKDNIIIPKNKKVAFEPGTTLNFIKGAFFVSWSFVKMEGTKQSPIKIISTDKSCRGFTVLQGNKESTLSYVSFEGLKTLDKDGWRLTGAVTFYESPVEINNCLFTNNDCEDGLNIVRSKFSINNSEISNTLSDGLDVDFSQGRIVGSIFHNTGNDCLDFSGSTVLIKDCEIKGSKDKGISCGEQSTITIEDVSIDNAVLGIASKDNSIVEGDKVLIKNCQTGFSAFQKKPEYGPSKIKMKNYKLEKVILEQKEALGSQIILIK